ncbi:M20/M25/M40 family metallo-hydrolase [Erysipelothrix sp. D19-032]
MKALLLKMIEDRMDEMIAIRRHLHQFPELSFAKLRQRRYIKNFYAGKPVQIDTISERHGFVVTINPGKSERVLALRADFDALPMQELVESSFKSQHDGIMHACGHDLHTAALMIAADSLITLRDQLPITIKIIHQHAEETPPGGGRRFHEFSTS